MDVFKLMGTIAINNSGANAAIDNTKEKASSLHKVMGKAFTGIGKAALSFGKVVAKGLAAGTAAMGTLVIKSMNLAGELEQNLGGTEAVFAHCATRMENVASKAYKNMGLSQSEYLAGANKMGAILQGMGFTISESSDMTVKLMQRAADVASIMGISTESAMEAVIGMSKGNFTMMDNLGVSMNETTLAAYALEKGMGKTYAQMSQNERIEVATMMFMERSAYAAGNYAKENDTLAGSLSTAKAAMINFLSGAGTADQMANAFVNAGEAMITMLDGLLPKLTKGIGRLMSKLTPKIGPMLQACLPGVIEGAVALITGLATALPDIITIVAEQLPFIFEQLAEAADELLPKLWNTIADTSKTLFDSIDFEGLGTTLGNAFNDLINNLPAILAEVGNVISYVWSNGVWPLLQGLFKAVFGIELPEWDDIVTAITQLWEDVKTGIKALFYLLFNIDLPDAQEIITKITDWWNSVVNSIKLALGIATGLQTTVHTSTDGGTHGGGVGPGFATGLDFVPYNEMPARLHYGEAVLTKEDASAWRSQQKTVVQNVNIDMEALATTIADAVQQRPVAMNIDGKTFAALMGKDMSRTIGNRNLQTLMGMGG